MNTPEENRAFFDHVRKLLLSGAITQEQAKDQTKERLEEMNAKGLEIAKKHGKRFRPFTFAGVMR